MSVKAMRSPAVVEPEETEADRIGYYLAYLSKKLPGRSVINIIYDAKAFAEPAILQGAKLTNYDIERYLRIYTERKFLKR